MRSNVERTWHGLVVIAASVFLGAGGVVAQGRTITDLGTIAAVGAGVDSTCALKGVSIERSPVQVASRVADTYAASIAVSNGNAIQLTEVAVADSPSVNVRAAAGTTSDKNGPIGLSHAIGTSIPVKPGTRGNIDIQWRRNTVTPGTALKAVVNINGRDIVAFDQNVASTVVRVAVSGTSGPLDIILRVAGVAVAQGGGIAAYHASLTVVFTPTGLPSPCKVDVFGGTCGMALVGQTQSLGSLHALDLLFGGAGPAVAQFLIVGKARSAPARLPGGCPQWVDPLAIIGLPANQRTLRLGFRPQSGLKVSFQVVSVVVSGTGFKILSSNGLRLSCP